MLTPCTLNNMTVFASMPKTPEWAFHRVIFFICRCSEDRLQFKLCRKLAGKLTCQRLIGHPRQNESLDQQISHSSLVYLLRLLQSSTRKPSVFAGERVLDSAFPQFTSPRLQQDFEMSVTLRRNLKLRVTFSRRPVRSRALLL